ncbi:hypothetical protein QF002_009054 [Paraburkholderia youngii]
MKHTILFLTLSDNADIVKINKEDAAMDHYTTKNFMLTESIGFRLVKARNVVVAEMDAALKDLDINGQQMGILLSLKQGVATTPFELSKLLGIDTGLMTRMLDKLESKGLLERSRDPQDRPRGQSDVDRAGAENRRADSGSRPACAERPPAQIHQGGVCRAGPPASQVHRRVSGAAVGRVFLTH